MKASVCSLCSEAPRDNGVTCVQPARILRAIMETLQMLSRRPRQRAQQIFFQITESHGVNSMRVTL